jgi:hypothetical protein
VAKVGKDKAIVAQGKPASFLRALDSEKAKAQVPESDKGVAPVILGPPWHRIRVTFDKNSQRKKIMIDFWKNPGDGTLVYVQHGEAQVVFAVEKKVLATIDDSAMPPAPLPDAGEMPLGMPDKAPN